jgi:hypothetical protein
MPSDIDIDDNNSEKLSNSTEQQLSETDELNSNDNESIKSFCILKTNKNLKFNQKSKYWEDIKLILAKNTSINISYVNDTLRREYNFNCRDYGFKSFTNFLQSSMYGSKINIDKKKEGMYISMKTQEDINNFELNKESDNLRKVLQFTKFQIIMNSKNIMVLKNHYLFMTQILKRILKK